MHRYGSAGERKGRRENDLARWSVLKTIYRGVFTFISSPNFHIPRGCTIHDNDGHVSSIE